MVIFLCQSHMPLWGIWISCAGLSLGKMAPIAKLSTEMKILAKNAVQKPETLKPVTRDETSRIIKALITNRNRPNVKKVNGKVRTMSSGLTTAFAKPSSSADTINAEVLLNRIPWNRRLVTQSEIAVMPQCSRKGERLLSMKVSLGVHGLASASSYCPSNLLYFSR